MAGDTDMGGWTDLLHSSTKLLEQATPSAQFPPLQRNLDQLESLSKKLKAKTLRTEAPEQSIAATRLLAREGINAEQLARDLKSFELKTTYEDVFPAEATTVEEYLQQVHEMTMISAIQEAQKDNLRSFRDHMMKVLEDDWQKEKRDFLQSLSRLSTLPRTSSTPPHTGIIHSGQLPTKSTTHISAVQSGLDLFPLTNKPTADKKASVYAEVVRNLNDSRQRGLPFNPAASFRVAYEHLNLDSYGGKSVSMQKIWHLIQALVGEGFPVRRNVSKKMTLVIGARHHLEWGHEKYILDTIQSHPAQASLGGVVGNLQKIRAFLRVRLRDHGLLDFDAGDARRQPPVDTTWQQIYFCLRTGYYDEAQNVAQSSRVASHFVPQLAEWISTGGMVSPETAQAASEECEKMLRMGDRAGRPGYDKKKLLLFALISGSRRLIERLLRDLPTLFNTIEDFLWFKLAVVRDLSSSSSVVLGDGYAPYSLDDLQSYLNKFEPSHYTKNGKDPLVYPYVLLLSIQLLPALMYLSKEIGDEGYNVDAVHISIVLADHGVLSEGGGGIGYKLAVMDIFAEVAGLIRQYGSLYSRHGNPSLALEYYAQAAAAVGGGQGSWSGHGNADQLRQRIMMLKQLLTEILLSDGGIALLLGPRGAGEEGLLSRFLTDRNSRQQYLLEAAGQCLGAGLYDHSVEIHKRIGAFAIALETINKCLSEAICALSRGRLDGESRTASLIRTSSEIMETYKYSEASSLEREPVHAQLTILRQLEAILHVHKLARAGQCVDALREITKLSFLPLDPRAPDSTKDVFQSLSPHVQVCVADLLKVALSCADNVTDSDGSVRSLRAKISNFVANNMSWNWPHNLYEKIARSL